MSNPRVYQIRQRAKLARRLFSPVSRPTAFLILFFILIATALYSGSSASSSRAELRSRQPAPIAKGENKAVKSRSGSSKEVGNQPGIREVAATLPSLTAGSLMQPPQPLFDEEIVTIYAANCTTPKSDFTFGDVVCAKIEGGYPLEFAPRRYSWVGPDNVIRQLNNVTVLGVTTAQFTIPDFDANKDSRGEWTVNSISPRASVRASATFNVSDQNNKVANLSVYNNGNTANLSAGSNVEFAIYVVNRGPDAAVNVQLTDVGTNATFSSATQEFGPNPAFSCSPSTGGTTCTIDRLEPGTKTGISVVYHTDGSAPVGTVITNTATISSDTNDAYTPNNSASAKLAITSESDESACNLVCPGDITVVANTTQNNVSGAIVKFDAETSGDCGTAAASPASGSFFPVGTTPVTISGASNSCTFNVKVTDTGAPTISCPAPIAKDVGSDCSASVTEQELGVPTTGGGTGELTVDADRSDGAGLDAPYSIGVTTITWKVTDDAGRFASCNQTVTVTGTDTAPPTITAPSNVTDTTGTTGASCGKIIGETELGTPATDDNCADSLVTVTRTGIPAGNFFPVGETTITYTATDKAGNTSQPVTQKVTITDNTPPVIKAPDDASYVCPSEVPAGNASQATRGVVLDENGNPLPPGPPSDNCGTPTVVVAESRSGAGSASSPLIISRVFTATDAAGNTASDTQTITVIDNTPPTLTLNNAGPVTVECHTTFTDPGASSSDNCNGPTTVSTTGSVDVNTPGTYTLNYTATDAAGNTTGPATRTVTVVDTTPPTITLTGTSSMTVECHTSFTDPGATANDGCAGSFAATANGSVNVNVPGTYTINYTASDPSGNAATPVARTVTVVDTTPPTLACPANITVYLPMNSTATSTVVNYQTPVGTDSCSTTTTTTRTAGLASGASFPVGTTTNSFTATDASGNSASCSFTVTVLYNFTGFFQPVGNLPVLNEVKAGRAVPVKFSLSGNKGLNIFAVGSPASQLINCDSNAPVSPIEETVTAGSSSLSYSPDQYNYVWKTESSWVGTCRQLIVTLNDGTAHRANFKFK